MNKEAAWEKTASWEDVRAKGEAILANGGVEIYRDDAQEVGAYVMSGVVEGMYPVTDGGPYEVILSKRSWENRNTGGWVQGFLCDCIWGSYHSGVPGAAGRFSGRFCSHAWATLKAANMRARKDFMGDRLGSSTWQRVEVDGEMIHERVYDNGCIGRIFKRKYWELESSDGFIVDEGRESNLSDCKASCDYYAMRRISSLKVAYGDNGGWNEHNFFMGTLAEWSFVPEFFNEFGEPYDPYVDDEMIENPEHPSGMPDYRSGSGSEYWYTPEGVYRLSDHWGAGVGTCQWSIEGDAVSSSWNDRNGERCGFCKWEDFESMGYWLTIKDDGEFVDAFEITPDMLRDGLLTYGGFQKHFFGDTEIDISNDAFKIAGLSYDKNNFYDDTFAEFYPCNAPELDPDYVSDSGSMYWYYPEGVVRGADHWGSDIGDCTWRMLGDEHDSSWDDPNGVRYGFCPWQGFERNLEENMGKTAVKKIAKMYTALVRLSLNETYVIRRDGYSSIKEFETDLRGNGYRVLKVWPGYVSDVETEEWLSMNRHPERFDDDDLDAWLEDNADYIDGLNERLDYYRSAGANRSWNDGSSQWGLYSNKNYWCGFNGYVEQDGSVSRWELEDMRGEIVDSGESVSFDSAKSDCDEAMNGYLARFASNSVVADNDEMWDAVLVDYDIEYEKNEIGDYYTDGWHTMESEGYVGHAYVALTCNGRTVCEFDYSPYRYVDDERDISFVEDVMECFYEICDELNDIGESADCESVVSSYFNNFDDEVVKIGSRRVRVADENLGFLDAIARRMSAAVFEKDQFGDWTKDYGDGTFGVIYEYDGKYMVDFSMPMVPLRTFEVDDFVNAQALCDDIHMKMMVDEGYGSELIDLYTYGLPTSKTFGRKSAEKIMEWLPTGGPANEHACIYEDGKHATWKMISGYTLFDADDKVISWGGDGIDMKGDMRLCDIDAVSDWSAVDMYRNNRVADAPVYNYMLINQAVERILDIENNQFKSWQSLWDMQEDEDVLSLFNQFRDMTQDDYDEACRRAWEESPLSYLAGRVAKIQPTTFENGTDERFILDALADELNHLCSETSFTVEDVYFDYGQGWKWTTVVAHDASGDWQALSPAEWSFALETGEVAYVARQVVKGDYGYMYAKKTSGWEYDSNGERFYAGEAVPPWEAPRGEWVKVVDGDSVYWSNQFDDDCWGEVDDEDYSWEFYCKNSFGDKEGNGRDVDDAKSACEKAYADEIQYSNTYDNSLEDATNKAVSYIEQNGLDKSELKETSEKVFYGRDSHGWEMPLKDILEGDHQGADSLLLYNYIESLSTGYGLEPWDAEGLVDDAFFDSIKQARRCKHMRPAKIAGWSYEVTDDEPLVFDLYNGYEKVYECYIQDAPESVAEEIAECFDGFDEGALEWADSYEDIFMDFTIGKDWDIRKVAGKTAAHTIGFTTQGGSQVAEFDGEVVPETWGEFTDVNLFMDSYEFADGEAEDEGICDEDGEVDPWALLEWIRDMIDNDRFGSKAKSSQPKSAAVAGDFYCFTVDDGPKKGATVTVKQDGGSWVVTLWDGFDDTCEVWYELSGDYSLDDALDYAEELYGPITEVDEYDDSLNKYAGAYDGMWEQDDQTGDYFKRVNGFFLNVYVMNPLTDEYWWAISDENSFDVIMSGRCESYEDGMYICDEEMNRVNETIPLGYDGYDFFNTQFEERMLDMGYPMLAKKAGVEWEAYEVVDGIPTSDVAGHMFSHGYDGWYLIRHDDEWGDKEFGPYGSIEELMSAHDLHGGNVSVAGRTAYFNYTEHNIYDEWQDFGNDCHGKVLYDIWTPQGTNSVVQTPLFTVNVTPISDVEWECTVDGSDRFYGKSFYEEPFASVDAAKRWADEMILNELRLDDDFSMYVESSRAEQLPRKVRDIIDNDRFGSRKTSDVLMPQIYFEDGAIVLDDEGVMLDDLYISDYDVDTAVNWAIETISAYDIDFDEDEVERIVRGIYDEHSGDAREARRKFAESYELVDLFDDSRYLEGKTFVDDEGMWHWEIQDPEGYLATSDDMADVPPRDSEGEAFDDMLDYGDVKLASVRKAGRRCSGVVLDTMSYDGQGQYTTTVNDENGHPLRFTVTDTPDGFGWQLFDTDNRWMVETSDGDDFSTAQDAVDDFNDWTDFNVNGARKTFDYLGDEDYVQSEGWQHPRDDFWYCNFYVDGFGRRGAWAEITPRESGGYHWRVYNGLGQSPYASGHSETPEDAMADVELKIDDMANFGELHWASCKRAESIDGWEYSPIDDGYRKSYGQGEFGEVYGIVDIIVGFHLYDGDTIVCSGGNGSDLDGDMATCDEQAQIYLGGDGIGWFAKRSYRGNVLRGKTADADIQVGDLVDYFYDDFYNGQLDVYEGTYEVVDIEGMSWRDSNGGYNNQRKYTLKDLETGDTFKVTNGMTKTIKKHVACRLAAKDFNQYINRTPSQVGISQNANVVVDGDNVRYEVSDEFGNSYEFEASPNSYGNGFNVDVRSCGGENFGRWITISEDDVDDLVERLNEWVDNLYIENIKPKELLQNYQPSVCQLNTSSFGGSADSFGQVKMGVPHYYDENRFKWDVGYSDDSWPVAYLANGESPDTAQVVAKCSDYKAPYGNAVVGPISGGVTAIDQLIDMIRDFVSTQTTASRKTAQEWEVEIYDTLNGWDGWAEVFENADGVWGWEVNKYNNGSDFAGEYVDGMFAFNTPDEAFDDLWGQDRYIEAGYKNSYTEPGQPRERYFDKEVVLPAIIDIWNLFDKYGVSDGSWEQVGDAVYMDESAWNDMLSKMNNPAWAEKFIGYVPMSGGSPSGLLLSRKTAGWENHGNEYVNRYDGNYLGRIEVTPDNDIFWTLLRDDDEYALDAGAEKSVEDAMRECDLACPVKKNASKKVATRQFTYAEQKELEDEIEGTELKNADRFKDGGAAYYGSL